MTSLTLPRRAFHRLEREVQRYRMDVLGRPAMLPNEIALLSAMFGAASQTRNPLRVFEWGMGNSTLHFARRLAKSGRAFEWHAMDNSAAWHARVGEMVRRHQLQDQVHLHLKEFPPFWETPAFDADEHRWVGPAPCTAPIREYVALPTTLGVPFDVMFVDGRYRRSCVETAQSILSPEGVVILHDAQRAHYHPALDRFPHARWHESGRWPGSDTHLRLWVGANGPSRLLDLVPSSTA